MTGNIHAQFAPSATTLTDVYTVPSGRLLTTIKTIIVCNRGASTTFRISIAPDGAADASKHYIYYDLPIGANDTFLADCAININGGDVIRVYAGSANLSFNILGVEETQ